MRTAILFTAAALGGAVIGAVVLYLYMVYIFSKDRP